MDCKIAARLSLVIPDATFERGEFSIAESFISVVAVARSASWPSGISSGLRLMRVFSKSANSESSMKAVRRAFR